MQPVPRDGVMAPIAAGANGAAAQPRWSVVFWIDDVDAAAGRAATLGGRVIGPARRARIQERGSRGSAGRRVFDQPAGGLASQYERAQERGHRALLQRFFEPPRLTATDGAI
jgi:hypothetical protein